MNSLAGLSKEARTWLLDPAEPSVRFRVLRDLLGRPPDDLELQTARHALGESLAVRKIFERMRPDGCWMQKNSAGRWVGDRVEYGSFATTHFVLAQLAELGLDRADPWVDQAANRYLSLVSEEGDFWRHMSCLTGFNVRTFLMLGFRGDPRLQRAIDLLVRTERHDGGFLCDLHEGKRKKRPVSSCARGSAKALLAFSELPETWQTPRCRAVVDYFLRREGLYRARDRTRPVVREATQTVFPFTWGCSVLDVLLAMSAMGLGRSGALARAWEVLEEKRDENGRYRLDWTPTQSLLKAGKRGAPNRWVTFYALLAHRLRRERSAKSFG